MIITLIISFKRKKRNELAGRFLIAFFWALWYYTLMSFLVLFNHAHAVPHLIRTGYLVSMIILLLSYFYVLEILKPRPLKLTDLLHLLPALIYLIDYFPFFILPGESKIALMDQLDATHLSIGFSEGWFMPEYGHFLIRSVQIIAYCTAQFLIIKNVTNSPEHPVGFGKPEMIRWLWALVILESIAFTTSFAAMAINPSAAAAVSNTVEITVSLILGVYLVFHPEILYGSSEYFQYSQNQPALQSSDNKEGEILRSAMTSSEPVSELALDKVEKELSVYLDTNKPFLKPGYKLLDLSNETGIPIYKISAYVNRRRNQNFFGYLNQYRLGHFMGKLASGEHESKTLEALAEECGFQSRSSFIRVFKSEKGMTPSEYLKTH